VEPIEINAGEFYLRALRSDDRIDDAAAIAEAFADPETERWLPYGIDGEAAARLFIGFRERAWGREEQFSWGICDAVTAELLGEVVLRDIDHKYGLAEVVCWSHPRHRGRSVVPRALNAVLPWGFQAIGLHRVVYKHAVENKASQRVAEKCGFTYEGRLRDAAVVDGQRQDMLQWSRLATDPAPEVR
jgi:RimJ/RimL family protein N-acetyltransferase